MRPGGPLGWSITSSLLSQLAVGTPAPVDPRGVLEASDWRNRVRDEPVELWMVTSAGGVARVHTVILKLVARHQDPDQGRTFLPWGCLVTPIKAKFVDGLIASVLDVRENTDESASPVRVAGARDAVKPVIDKDMAGLLAAPFCQLIFELSALQVKLVLGGTDFL